MGFLDDARSEVKAGGIPCSLCQKLDEWKKADQAEFWSALDDLTIPATAIQRALRKRGVAVNEGTIQKHRREGCRRRGVQ